MPLAEPLQQIERTLVLHRARRLIYFGGCDYFRLASHPDVWRALHEGVEKFGLNVAASRSTTGNHTLFGRLETELAKFFGVERAALLSNGYATNLAFAQTFSDRFTHALMDERSHGSLRDASEFLRCPVLTFRHRDTKDFFRMLKLCGRNPRLLVLTDGMFSHDGSLAPLRQYLNALLPHAMLLVDDAHGAGTLGKSGKGTPEICGVRDKRVVQTISLSKAFGVYGGAVLGPARVIDAIQEHSRIFNGNTPPPLPLVNAALVSLNILRTDPSLRVRLIANSQRIKTTLRSAGLPVVDNTSPIVAMVPRNAQCSTSINRQLFRAGIFPSRIHYATGPAYFRFAISSEHTTQQLNKLVEVLIGTAH